MGGVQLSVKCACIIYDVNILFTVRLLLRQCKYVRITLEYHVTRQML